MKYDFSIKKVYIFINFIFDQIDKWKRINKKIFVFCNFIYLIGWDTQKVMVVFDKVSHQKNIYKIMLDYFVICN